MNATTHTICLKLRSSEVFDAVSGLLHTLLFYRSTAVGDSQSTARGKQMTPTSITFVHCKSVDFSHVRVESPALRHLIQCEANLFLDELRLSKRKRGSLCLEFFEKSREWFLPRHKAWEIWTVDVSLIEATNLERRFKHQIEVAEALMESVISIGTAINSSFYMPLAHTENDIAYIYDTSYAEFQPYLFSIRRQVGFNSQPRSTLSDLERWLKAQASLL